MTTIQLSITSYHIQFASGLTNNINQPVFRNRFITLIPAPNPNQVNQVSLAFVTESTLLKNVGIITRLANNSLYVRTAFLMAEYDPYYDLIRSEKPLNLRFDFEGVPQFNVDTPLQSLQLGPYFEPVGEGPADASS